MLTRRVVGRCVGLGLLFALGPSWAASLGSLSTPAGLVAAVLTVIAAKSLSLQTEGGALAAVAVLVLLAAGLLLRRGRRVALPSTLIGRNVKPASERHVASKASLPAGYQPEALMAMASQHFMQLQAAWDAGDLEVLQALTTADMLAELRAQLPVRGPGANRTDVVSLRADLLGFDELSAAYVVSVEFSGMIRERADKDAVPFRELWMLARSKENESGWLLARHQALL